MANDDENKTEAKGASELKEELGKLKGELEQLAGEIRVKIHLASLDVKDTWNDVEPRLKKFQEDVNKVASVTGSELKAAALDLKARAKKIRDALS
jgi:hypothetical protein